MKTKVRLLIAVLIMGMVTGCASIGPGTVSRDRFDYVSSISESWKQQILLNIVKTRYLEPVSFVDVGQIVAGYTLESGVNLGASDGKLNSFVASSYSASVSGKYTDRPTITFTPITGNTFIKTLMTPLHPSRLMFAIQSGVPADLIFKLGVSSINGLRNEQVYIGNYVPVESKFVRVIELVNELQKSGAISVKIVKHNDSQETPVLSFLLKEGDSVVSGQVRDLCELLGLDQSVRQYRIVYGIAPENNREVAMQTASVMRIMTFMAARVDIPDHDIAEKRATPGLREAIGSPGNDKRFVIKSSGWDWEPKDAYAAVKYRNRWFWIDDRDLLSKRALSFLVLVFTLADTGNDKSLPLITKPAQ